MDLTGGVRARLRSYHEARNNVAFVEEAARAECKAIATTDLEAAVRGGSAVCVCVCLCVCLCAHVRVCGRAGGSRDLTAGNAVQIRLSREREDALRAELVEDDAKAGSAAGGGGAAAAGGGGAAGDADGDITDKDAMEVEATDTDDEESADD